MGADFPMIPHESALFSRAYKPTSLGDRPLSGHGEGICPPDTIVCALQQFPLMACEAYTTYVGGVSMGNVMPRLSLWTPRVPSKGRHTGRQADSGLFPDAPPPWGWSLSGLYWVGPSDGVEKLLR